MSLRADPPASRTVSGPLVARERELETLRAALQVTEVDGRCVVIGGDAGSGKSALLAAFRAVAGKGSVAVVEGACVEVESRRPFGVFADLVASCERTFGSQRVARSLEERGVLVRQLTAAGASAPDGTSGDRHRLHGAIIGLIGDLTSDGPVAVLLEDLHWADAASLELFSHITRRLRGLPVLLVATYRTDELDRRHPLRPALADLRKARLVQELAVPPLDSEGTGALIRARLGLRDPAPLDIREFRDLVHERCEGNPLHVEETLDTLRQSGHLVYADGAWSCEVHRIRDAIPATVADGVIARWARLTAPTRQLLLVASVVGHRLDIELLASVAAMPPDALPPLIHEAIDARLVLEETKDRPLSFRHQLTREALQQELLRSERAALHARIAAAMLRRRPTHAVLATELAYHLEEAGDLASASRHHEEAARDAAAITDYGGAARSMERAIATAGPGDRDDGRRQLALVGYLRLSGDDARAARAATAALAIGERSGDTRLQGRALLELYAGEYRNSDTIPATTLLDRARLLLEPLGPAPELARVYSMLAGDASRRGDGDAAVALAERAREMARTLDLPAELARATLQVGSGLYRQGHLDQYVATCRTAVEIARGAGLVDEQYGGLVTLRVALGAAGAPAAEQREARQALRALARSHGLGKQDWIVRELSFLHQEADWDGFLKLLPEVPEPQRSDFDQPRLMAMFVEVARNGPGAASDLDVAGLSAAYGNSAPSACWAAELLLLAGRAKEAAELASSVDDAGTRGRYWGLIPASTAHAIGLFAARECEDPRARERFVSSLMTERPRPVTPNFNQRHVALASGDLAERAGRIDEALAAYAVALALCERDQYSTSVMFLMSLIRQRRAELYLRAAPPDAASAQVELNALLPYWRKANATWYLRELRTWAERHELAFPAAEPPDRAAASRRELTRRELEVARLVAHGLTNLEIGARLTLSSRTVESHVEHVRAKLGFRARSQIAAWIERNR